MAEHDGVKRVEGVRRKRCHVFHEADNALHGRAKVSAVLQEAEWYAGMRGRWSAAAILSRVEEEEEEEGRDEVWHVEVIKKLDRVQGGP